MSQDTRYKLSKRQQKVVTTLVDTLLNLEAKKALVREAQQELSQARGRFDECSRGAHCLLETHDDVLVLTVGSGEFAQALIVQGDSYGGVHVCLSKIGIMDDE